MVEHPGFSQRCHLFLMSSSNTCGSTPFGATSLCSGKLSASFTPVSQHIALTGERRSRESSIRKHRQAELPFRHLTTRNHNSKVPICIKVTSLNRYRAPRYTDLNNRWGRRSKFSRF
ncbi:hypothetical protein [Gimesia maris]|uniref:hypothetical protein n=1 Tax=Gimesia maris TaxID=122 RepID=UPI0012B882D6|nr:hypothetical protein [Gimesia maris]